MQETHEAALYRLPERRGDDHDKEKPGNWDRTPGSAGRRRCVLPCLSL